MKYTECQTNDSPIEYNSKISRQKTAKIGVSLGGLVVSFNITECNWTDCVSGVHFQSAKVYLRIALLSLQSAKAW